MAPRTMSTVYSRSQVGLLKLLPFFEPSPLLPPTLSHLASHSAYSLLQSGQEFPRVTTVQTILLVHMPFPLYQCCLLYPVDSSSRSGKASFGSKPSLEFDLEFFTRNYSILSWFSVSMKKVNEAAR